MFVVLYLLNIRVFIPNYQKEAYLVSCVKGFIKRGFGI